MKYSFKLFILLAVVTVQLLLSEQLESKKLYLEYTSYPKRVFTGQRFEVHLKALILNDKSTYDKIITTFTQEDGIKLLIDEIKWHKDDDDSYSTTLIYKVFDQEFVLPRITLTLYKDTEIVDFISIKSPNIQYERIAINQDNFSNIIAKNLTIISAKTKQYTNNILHTTLNIKAQYSNLEDFKLNSYKSAQGVSSLTTTYPEQDLYYYVLIPTHTKNIQFTYYNSVEKRFIKVQVPIILDEDLVSTQTELNPYNSNILIYKQIAVAIVLLVFILIFFKTKKVFYLVFVALFFMILTYLFMPNKKIVLDKGVKVYILPTSHSTIFKKLEHKQLVEIINQKENFVKVLFDNENIGWVKKYDIQ